jgi:hypothetical protein
MHRIRTGGAMVNLTRQGRRALRSGKLAGASPGAILAMEVLARTGVVTADHCTTLLDGLLNRYGSPETALGAIRSGFVGFEKIDAA